MDFLGIDVEQTLISAGTENDLLTPQSLLKTDINSQEILPTLNSETLLASPIYFAPSENSLLIEPETNNPSQDLLTGQALNNFAVLSNGETDLNIISQPQKNTLLEGLSAFVQWIDTKLETAPSFTKKLAYTDENLAHLTNFSDLIKIELVTPIQNYFQKPEDSTAQGLLEVLKSLPIITNQNLVTITVNTDNLGNITQLKFNLDIKQEKTEPINLNVEIENQLKLQEQNQINLTGSISSNFNFGFQVQNSNPEFFVDINSLNAQGLIDQTFNNSVLNLGVLKTNVDQGHINLNAESSIQIVDPNHNNQLTLDELTKTPNEILVTINLNGTLNALLPLEVANTSIAPKVIISDNNLFDSFLPEISYSNPQLKAFSNLKSEQLQNIIENVGNTIQELAGQLNLENGVPYLEENINDVINFSELLTDFSKSISESSVIGNIDLSTSKISQDAIFYIWLDNDPQKAVGVRVIKDDTNQNINDLIKDINDAFTQARINNFVEAIYRDGKLVIKTLNINDQFKLSNPDSITSSQLGLVEQVSNRNLFPFTTLFSLKDLNVNQNTVTVDLTLNKTFNKDIHLDFQKEINTDVGKFTFIGNSNGTIEVSLDLKLGLIIDLNEIGSTFNLSGETLLSSLNGGKGINNKDIRITLSDGTTAEITFDGDLTVGDIINSIISHPNLQNKINVQINPVNQSLKFIDLRNGTSEFSIQDIPGHSIGTGLGIIDVDSTATIQGKILGDDIGFTTLLSSLDTNQGINNIAGDDIQISLKDGTTAAINFDGDMTIGDVIESIINHENLKGKINVTLNGEPINSDTDNKTKLKNVSLTLNDLTTGTEQFKITTINGHVAGEKLGIIGTDRDGVIQSTALNVASLSSTTLLSSLNNGKGVNNTELNDVKITLRDGTIAEVNFGQDNTINNVINSIENHPNLKNKVKIEIVQTDPNLETKSDKSLKVIDLTQGEKIFSIVAIPGHLEGLGLGILGLDPLGRIKGNIIGDNLSNSNKLSDLNNGSGIQYIANQPDLKFTLRDGSSFEVDLVITPNTTLNNIIEAIELASNNRVQVSITTKLDPTTNTNVAILKLEDTTSGNGTFTIISLPNTSLSGNISLIGQDLGILGFSLNGVIEGTPITRYAVPSLTPANLTFSTPLDTLNTGKGIRQLENQNDLQFNLKNGETILLDLNISDSTTIGELINFINTSTNEKVIASLNSDETGLSLVDNTSGINRFTVTSVNNSLAGLDLGILGTTTNSVLNGKAINQVLNGTTKLLDLNNGNGVRNSEADLEITLRDGTTFMVDLNNVSTIQNVIDIIQNASKGDGENAQPRVLVNVYQDENNNLQSLVLIDQTMGAEKLTVKALNNSLAGQTLGILGSDTDGIIQGKSVHGDSFSNHIFITRDSQISVGGKVTANNIDLNAAFGFFKANVQDGAANFEFTASAELQDVNQTDLGISLEEVFINPTLVVPTPKYTAQGDITLPIVIQGLDQFGLGTPEAKIQITFQPTASPELGITTTAEVTADLPGVPDIEAKLQELANFSTDDLLLLIERTITFFQNDNLGLFNQKIPLLNQSLNDLLNFLQPIINAYNGIKNNLENLQSELFSRLAQLEDLVLDPALLFKIPETLSEKLQSAFTNLDTAIQNLPTGLEILSHGIPSELIIAVSQLEEVINSLPSAALTTIKNQLDQAIATLPISDKTAINQAKNNLYNVISQPDINLESFRKAFDEFRIEIASLLDPVLAQAIINLQLVVTDLETVPIQEISGVIAKIATVLDSLPANVAKTDLITAKNKIQQAINTVDYNLLNTGIDDLKEAMLNLSNLGLAGIEEIFSQLTGFLVKDTFDKLINKIPAITDIEKFIADLIGIDDLDVSLSLNSENTLIVNLDWDKTAQKPVRLDFSLDEPFRNFVSLEADIEVSAEADISLDFGIDLSTTPDIYLLPSTQLDLRAKFDAQVMGEAGINNLIKAQLGPGNVSLLNGSNDSASFSLKLEDGNNDGKITFTPDSGDSIKVDNSLGTIQGYIPVSVKILDTDTSIGYITIAQTSWTSPVTINTDNLVLSKLDLANLDTTLLQAGVNQFLKALQKGLESDILKSLPIIGDKVSGKLSGFIDKLRQEINKNFDDITIDPTTGEVIFDLKLNDSFTFDTNFDLGLDGLKFVDLNAEGGVVVSLGYNLDFKIGVDKSGGFFFRVSPTAPEFDFDLTIALANETKISSKLFFLEVEATNLNERETAEEDDKIDYNKDGVIKNVDYNKDGVIKNVDYNKDGDKNDTTGFNGNLALNIIDPTPNDNKITLNDLGNISFSGKLSSNGSDNLEFNILLKLVAGTGDEDLPSVVANLGVSWKLEAFKFNGFDTQNFSSKSMSKEDLGLTVGLYDIGLDVGEFITKTIGSTLKTVDTYIEPLRPILDFLKQEIPIVSPLYQLVGLGKFTVLDAIGLYGDGGPEAKKALQVIITIDDILRQIKNFDDNLIITYGDLVFDQDLRFNSSVNLYKNDFSSALGNFDDVINKISAKSPSAASLIEQSSGNNSNSLGIEFPIFKDPSNIIKLLFGQDADLVTWQIPEIKAGFRYQQLIGPIFPPYPIFLTISAGLKIFADLSIGFDTRGLRTGDFLDGFYFGDRANISRGKDTPELGLIAFIAAGLQLNLVVATIGVEGGLQVGLFADWNDPNRDGKVHFDELLSNARRSWMCVFDFKGELAAFLDAYVTIGYKPVIVYQGRYTLLYLPLFSFTKACQTDVPLSPSGQPETSSTLGHYSTGEGEDAGIEKGTLIVHVGRFAHLRQPGVSVDTDEQVYVTRLKSGALELHSPFRSDYRQQSDDPYPTGSVQVFGDDPNESVVTKLYIDTGIGDDLVEIDELVTVDAIVLGGDGNDTILIRTGTDPLTGRAFSHYIEGGSGNDRIVSSIGNDTIIGGVSQDTPTGQDGNDTIVGGGGDDIAIGDNGKTTPSLITSIAPSNGGNDIILVSGGNDTVIGGVGNDHISGNQDNTGEDILLGDNGYIERNNETNLIISSTDFANGGNDEIIAGADRDTVIGGAANDKVANSNDLKEDLIYGDQGYLDATLIKSLSDTSDGNDTLYGESGNDTILGGGKDDLISGVQGEDILFGDHGQIVFNQDIISYIQSTDFTNGGNDTLIAGIDKDTVIGGAANDIITNDGDTSPDVLYGDQGYWDATIISNLTDPNDGDDKIYSEGGNDTILAGGAKDYVESGTDLDIVLGDHGIVTRNAGIVIRIETTESDSGDDDVIFAGNDDDTVLGGPKNDRITGDTSNNGDDILIGDQGYWTPEVIVAEFDSLSNPDGEDTIFGNGGNDTVFGNDDRDYIEGNQGLDILVGDYGIIEHTGKLAKRIDTIDATRKNIDVTKGNDDFIDGGDNNDTILGGTASDSLVGGYDDGRDIILGDNGTVVNADDGSSQSNDIFSHSPLYGGIDRVYAGPGDDTIVGGSGGKDTTDPKASTLTGKTGDGISGNEGNDIVVGDNAYITRNSSEKVEKIEIAISSYGGVKTIAANYGGDDYILGNSGNDSLIGGFGKDSIDGGNQEDIILGDNALFDYSLDANVNTLDLVITTNVTLGDNDTLLGDQGNDLIFGGTRSDTISGGSGNDLIFGDHGKAEGNITLTALPLNQINPPFTFTAIATQIKDLGGNDSIHGDSDDDIILGQQGNDRLFGDDGQDDLIGGHNVISGADGGDEIDGGAGNDAIAGDNAIIQRRTDTLSPRMRVLSGTILYDANGNPQISNASQLDPTGTVGRNIQLLNDSITGTYGNDAIAGGANNDLIFGQLGNDTIQGDSSTTQKPSLIKPSVESVSDGDDYIEGNGGKDLIFGNLGQDDIIGGSSNLFGNSTASERSDDQDTIFGGAGTRISLNDPGTSDHVRDADLILGDNGNIFRLVGLNGINSSQFLTFNYNRAIARVVQFLDYTVDTTTGNLGNNDLIQGEAGDDEIYGLTGNDVIFGNGEDDNLYGGAGSDHLYGGTGDDGIIGDDGQILTSRNGQTESLFGISVKTISQTISIPNILIGAVIYPINTLNKQALLLGMNGGNDVIYGGLGNDFLHGGAGDDAISGAEALPSFYNTTPVSKTNPLSYNMSTRKLAAYDATNPRQKINNFLLNFDAFTVNPKNGNITKINDGIDHIFGDLGNDWLVGGTQNDRLFGGLGDDVINADDNHDTNGGLNNKPDDSAYADGDFAFGGGGLDILIANTGKDRLFDWVNDFNTYIVPFEFFESPVITRLPSTDVIQFLLKLGKASGADQSKTEPNGELGLIQETDPEWIAQIGSPRDPKGNIPGVLVDTLGEIEKN